MDHKLIPQRNINLRFNLSDTSHFLTDNSREYLLEKVYFSGLHDHYSDIRLKLSGKVDTFGICFYPNGFYPFLKIPVVEFKNQLLGAGEIGFKISGTIRDQLMEVSEIKERLEIIETELLTLLMYNDNSSDDFSIIFKQLINTEFPLSVSDFCAKNNICIRKLERMFNKHVGISASTFFILNRFHSGLNQLLNRDFSKLSDIAYDKGYFDQMHFIKEFKRFTGNTPKNFVIQSNSILQIGKLT